MRRRKSVAGAQHSRAARAVAADGRLAQAEPLATTPGEAVSYRLRDDQPPFLESVVTLQIVPDAGGGSLLRIIHQLDAANDGPTTMMCAA